MNVAISAREVNGYRLAVRLSAVGFVEAGKVAGKAPGSRAAGETDDVTMTLSRLLVKHTKACGGSGVRRLW